MLVRTITGLVMLPLLLLLLFAPSWGIALGLALISGIAVLEVLGHWPSPITRRVRTAASCFSLVVYALIYFEAGPYVYLAAFFLFLLYLFVEVLLDSSRFGFFGLVGVFFCGTVFPVLYSSILRLTDLPERSFVILIPFMITVNSDVFALYTGKLFGRHKLAPLISPAKTIEGAAGGYVFCVGAMIVYGIVAEWLGCQVHHIHLLVYALLGGIVSQLGDLAMSAAKRSLGTKDFGKIFPGHGGVLDRFDSLLFVAPLIELLVFCIPAIRLP